MAHKVAKHKVLVFPCGSEIGLEIYRSLNVSTHFELYGGASVDDHGKFVYPNYIGGIPYVDDPNFISKINDVITDHKIDLIFPAHDDVLVKLAQAEAAGELKAKVVTSNLKTCEITRSKQKTYQCFSGVIPTPTVYKSPKDVQKADLPVFLKPDVGQGSKGTHKAATVEEIEFYRRKDPSLLIVEYLPGKMYTVECFTDRTGKLLFCEGRERARVMNGISVSSFTVEDTRFQDLAGKINNTLNFRGAWFFQVKQNYRGELVLMEIAPRIAGTSALARNKGVNLSLLSLFDALEQEVSVFANKYELTIDRSLEAAFRHNIRYNHVYIDFDDTVIFENMVNPKVIAFIYQCINKNIKVHLITRHKNILNESLKTNHLEGVFDDLIWLKKGEDKHMYIKEEDAIFIDDSFAERKSVHDALNIPVFDSHMIESLMETF